MALTDPKSRIEDSVSPYFNSESSYTADMNQDGQKNDLIYIPNTKDELLFINKNGFTAADQANGRHSQSGQSAEQLLGSNKKHERLQRRQAASI